MKNIINNKLPQEIVDYVFSLSELNICAKFKDLISAIIIKKNYENLQRIIIKLGEEDWGHSMDRFFYDYYIHYFTDSAIENGHIGLVKWLHENTTESFKDYNMNSVARKGHLEVVKWLHENRTNYKHNLFTTDAMNLAAQNGHLEVVKFLHENRDEGCTTIAMDKAAKYGHLEVVKFLHFNGKGCTKDAINDAAKYGHLEIVKFLHENTDEGCTKDAMHYAVSYGHLEILKWLHENRTSKTKTKLKPESESK